jgi:TonB family protein
MKAVPQGPVDGKAPQTARTRRIEAVVLSSDDGLIIDLGPVLGDRYRTRPVDSIDELAGNPPETQWLVLLDAAHRPNALEEAGQLGTRWPTAPIIVIIAAGAENRWLTALSHGGVTAVVARERIGEQPMQRALEAAERRLLTQDSPTVPLHTVSASGARPRLLLPAAGALAALLAAAAAWYLWHARGSTPSAPVRAMAVGVKPAPRPAAGPTAAPARPALELLSAARIAFASQRQLPRAEGELKGDSALELYVQALSVDPRNEEARDGVRRLFSLARPRIQAALAAGRFDDATRLIELLRASGLEQDAASGFDAELAAARPRWYATQVQEALAAGNVPAAEQALAQLATFGADPAVMQPLQEALAARRQDLQLADMANAVHSAIAAGNLLEPLADNARTRVQAMRQISRSNAATLAAQHEYAAALLARVQDSAHAQQFDTAQRYLTAADDVAAPEELAAARQQLQSEVDAAARRAAAAAAAPPGNASKAAAPVIINAHPSRPLSASYPATALEQKITGYVVVEFTLRADGRAADPSVVESHPAGVFDAAALAGVAGGRFDTSALGADHKPQRARIRVSFK